MTTPASKHSILPEPKPVVPPAPVCETRAISWSYPPDITPAQAARAARRFRRRGANTLLTEDNRYLLYAAPAAAPPPHFHFRPTARSLTLPATRIVAEAMHAEGIRIIHHVTACYASRDFMDRHRDWTQRDARRPEEPLFFGDYGGVWLFCPNNPGFRGAFFDTLLAFAKDTGVDGWMIDEVEFLPDWFSCGCSHCRTAFGRDTGNQLPNDPDSPTWGDFDDPVWRAWIAWRMTGPARFFADLRARLEAEMPGSILTTCHAGLADTWSAQYWGIDEVAVSPHLNLVFHEAYVRDSLPFHGWPRFSAELDAYSACARGTPNPPLALFYPRTAREGRFCWALAASRGHRLWAFVPGSGQTPRETLGDATTSPLFRWQSDHEHLFRPAEPFARIGLLFSKPSRDMVSPMDNTYYIDEWAGWATAMLESNIPFRVVLDRDLARADGLRGVGLLVMPNTACLSDADMAAVSAFRDAGGKVLATADTAVRDETGALRDTGARSAFVAGIDMFLSDAPGRGALRRYARKGEPQPLPEEPSAVARIAGILRRWDGAIPWSTDAPWGVSVNVMRRADGSLAVHLLNATGALGGVGRRARRLGTRSVIRPQRAHEIAVQIEATAPPAAQPLLHCPGDAAPQPCACAWNDGRLRITVPALDEYAVVEVPAPSATE